MDAPKGFWSEPKEKWLHSGDLIAECKDFSLGRCKLHKQALLLLSKEKWILDQTNIFIAVLGCKWEFWTGYLPEFARARNKQVSAGCQRKLFLLNAFLFPSCWDVNWNFWIQQNEIKSFFVVVLRCQKEFLTGCLKQAREQLANNFLVFFAVERRCGVWRKDFFYFMEK